MADPRLHAILLRRLIRKGYIQDDRYIQPEDTGRTTAVSSSSNVFAVDCEMVGVGKKGFISILARVSVVDYNGLVKLDTFVKATQPVTNYRTEISGVREEDMVNGENAQEVRRQVRELLRGKIVVGHALHNDLRVLQLQRHTIEIRDTQHLGSQLYPGPLLGLRKLTKLELDLDIQTGEHSSVEDARAAMALYRLYEYQWQGFTPTVQPKIPRAPRSGKTKKTKNTPEKKKKSDPPPNAVQSKRPTPVLVPTIDASVTTVAQGGSASTSRSKGVPERPAHGVTKHVEPKSSKGKGKQVPGGSASSPPRSTPKIDAQRTDVRSVTGKVLAQRAHNVPSPATAPATSVHAQSTVPSILMATPPFPKGVPTTTRRKKKGKGKGSTKGTMTAPPSGSRKIAVAK